MRPIYLDYNATTPIEKGVLDAMLPFFETEFGNPASQTHAYGWGASHLLTRYRETIANFLHRDPSEITFTSGASESINAALKGMVDLYGSRKNHIIAPRTEHKAVINSLKYLEKNGTRVDWVSVDSDGIIQMDELEELVSEDTLMVCAMLVNNETGVIQPLSEISKICRSKGAFLLSDATQAYGKMPIDIEEMGIDIMAWSGHKIYGPKGVGGLFLRKRKPKAIISPLIHGGGHEQGLRSGTPNMPGIAGLSMATELASLKMKEDAVRILSLRDHLEANLLRISDSRLNGHTHNRIYNVTNIAFKDIEANSMVKLMSGIAISTGSACSSALKAPSHVLSAMGLEESEAFGSLRISLGRATTGTDIETAIDIITKGIARLRSDREASR